MGADAVSKEHAKEIQRVEEQIQRAIPIGDVVETRRFTEGLVKNLAFSQYAVTRAIQIMISRNELQHFNQQRSLKRVR